MLYMNDDRDVLEEQLTLVSFYQKRLIPARMEEGGVSFSVNPQTDHLMNTTYSQFLYIHTIASLVMSRTSMTEVFSKIGEWSMSHHYLGK